MSQTPSPQGSPGAPSRRRRGRPPAGDSAETRDRLLAVARRAFATRGYDATTNKDIAEEAGITTGAIYHYFRSKADLYVAAYDQVQQIVLAEFEKAVAGEADLVTKVWAMLDAAVGLNRRDSSITEFVVNVPWEAAHHPDLRLRTAGLSTKSLRFFEAIVAEAVASGELAAGVDQEIVVDVISVVTSGLARFAHRVGDPGRHARAADGLKGLLAGCGLSALRAPTAIPSASARRARRPR